MVDRLAGLFDENDPFGGEEFQSALSGRSNTPRGGPTSSRGFNRDFARGLSSGFGRGAAIGSLGPAGITAYGAGQFLGFAGDRLQEYAAYDQQIRDIITLVPQAESALSSFFTNTTDLSVQLGQSIGSITSSVYDIVSATGEWERSFSRATESGILALGGQTNIQTAATGITIGSQAFGVGERQTSDIIAEAVRIGRIRAEGVVSGLGAYGGAAAGLGVGLDDATAIQSFLTTTGLSPALAATSTQNFLVQLSRPQSELSRVLEPYLGTSPQEFLTSGTGDIADIVDALDQSGRNPYDITTIRAARGAAGLLRDPDRFRQFTETIGDSEGAADRAFDIAARGAENRLERLFQRFEATARDVGEEAFNVLDATGIIPNPITANEVRNIPIRLGGQVGVDEAGGILGIIARYNLRTQPGFFGSFAGSPFSGNPDPGEFTSPTSDSLGTSYGRIRNQPSRALTDGIYNIFSEAGDNVREVIRSGFESFADNVQDGIYGISPNFSVGFTGFTPPGPQPVGGVFANQVIPEDFRNAISAPTISAFGEDLGYLQTVAALAAPITPPYIPPFNPPSTGGGGGSGPQRTVIIQQYFQGTTVMDQDFENRIIQTVNDASAREHLNLVRDCN